MKKAIKAMGKLSEGVSITQVTDTQFRELKNRVRKTEGMDYAFFEIDKDYYDPKLSRVIIAGDRIAAAMLIHKNMGGMLVLDFFKWFDPATPKDAMGLIIGGYSKAKDIYREDIYVSCRIRSDQGAAIIDKIAPGHTAIPIFRGILTKDTEVTAKDWLGTKEIFRMMLENMVPEGRRQCHLDKKNL